MKRYGVLLLIGAIIVIGLFSRFLGSRSWDLSRIKPPWGSRPAIYAHIQAHIVQGKSGLSDGGDELPDSHEVFEEGRVRWVAGAMDGVFAHHGGGGNEQDRAKTILGLLRSVLQDPTQERVGELYEASKRASTIDFVDPLLELAANHDGIDADRLHDLSLWLATQAADREPVKMAIAFLGVVRGYDDRETILTLARHDEFTLFAAVAVTNHEKRPERTIWHMAKQVEGWGRVQAVQRLAHTTDPEIKCWLLREGYKNSIMYEYLAYTCATAGELHSALAADQIDEALLLGAGDILDTLVRGQDGPAEGMDDYEHGAAATAHFLRHLDGRADRLEQFLVLKTIEGFLTDADEDWTERANRGWTTEARQSMLPRVERYLGDRKWRGLAEAGLKSAAPRTFGVASEAAAHLGIDTWDEYYSSTKAGGDYWFHLMQTKDRLRIAKVVELAETRIPLAAIATGPGNELGLGPEFRHHSALDFVLQDLGKFPGLGWPLIEAGLRSPVTRNRHMAIRALAGWNLADWPEGAKAYVEACRDAEPNEDVRGRLVKLLAGQPLETVPGR